MDRAQVRLALLQGSDFHICPASGKVLMSPKHDDKALCWCGLSSPALIRLGVRDAPGTHLKSVLQRSTAQQYIEQEDKAQQKKQQFPHESV